MPSPSTVLLRTQSDERLVALVRTGHERAFDAIVERYRKPLLRACRRILPEARAEDALQQALVAAWKGLERGDDVHELRPWLYRIARNTALNQLRMAGYDLEELVETLSATHDPEEEVLRRAVVRQTLAAVAALPERQREALLRTAVEGRGQDEVARDLGLSDTAVRALVHRARMRVRAAATALVPLPMAAWAAGAGGTGAAVTLAKAGTIAVLAGAVATPALIRDRPARPHAVATHAAKPRARTEAHAAPTPAPTVAARAVLVATAPARHAAPARPAPRTSHRGHEERTDRSGRDDGSALALRDDSSGDDGGHSGSGGGDHDGGERSGGDDSGSGSGGEDRHSGEGGGDDGHEAADLPVETATPVVESGADDHHGDGSGSGDDTTSGSSGDGSSGTDGHDD
jgi:RNA polymerase sigma factor (sigma-70 family)